MREVADKFTGMGSIRSSPLQACAGALHKKYADARRALHGREHTSSRRALSWSARSSARCIFPICASYTSARVPASAAFQRSAVTSLSASCAPHAASTAARSALSSERRASPHSARLPLLLLRADALLRDARRPAPRRRPRSAQPARSSCSEPSAAPPAAGPWSGSGAGCSPSSSCVARRDAATASSRPTAGRGSVGGACGS